jgi:hypothetical protein
VRSVKYKGGYWLLMKWSDSVASLATWIPEAHGMTKAEDLNEHGVWVQTCHEPGVQRPPFQLERASQQVTFCSKRDKWLVVEAEVCPLLDFRPFTRPTPENSPLLSLPSRHNPSCRVRDQRSVRRAYQWMLQLNRSWKPWETGQ